MQQLIFLELLIFRCRCQRWKSSNESLSYFYATCRLNDAFVVILCCRHQQTVVSSPCWVLKIFVRFYPNLGFLAGFSWKFPLLNLTKILSIGAQPMWVSRANDGRTDRQTDTTKLQAIYTSIRTRLIMQFCPSTAWRHMLVCRRSRGTAPPILDLTSRWRKVAMNMKRPFYPLQNAAVRIG
jgi:hypothetical protein